MKIKTLTGGELEVNRDSKIRIKINYEVEVRNSKDGGWSEIVVGRFTEQGIADSYVKDLKERIEQENDR